MQPTIAIIDYGSGNLRSVAKSFERAAERTGHHIMVTSDPRDLTTASHIVLPGVGAFGDCIAGLKALDGMIATMEEEVLEKKKPFLGICVGMQLLADTGYEHGIHQGLGWIPGEVKPIEPQDPSLKIPHMGWNDLNIMQPEHPLLQGIHTGDHAYFVHSFYFACHTPKAVIASVDYGGMLPAVLAHENIVATQFHPEKSQEVGGQLIINFLIM